MFEIASRMTTNHWEFPFFPSSFLILNCWLHLPCIGTDHKENKRKSLRRCVTSFFFTGVDISVMCMCRSCSSGWPAWRRGSALASWRVTTTGCYSYRRRNSFSGSSGRRRNSYSESLGRRRNSYSYRRRNSYSESSGWRRNSYSGSSGRRRNNFSENSGKRRNSYSGMLR